MCRHHHGARAHTHTRTHALRQTVTWTSASGSPVVRTPEKMSAEPAERRARGSVRSSGEAAGLLCLKRREEGAELLPAAESARAEARAHVAMCDRVRACVVQRGSETFL